MESTFKYFYFIVSWLWNKGMNRKIKFSRMYETIPNIFIEETIESIDVMLN